jgi:hypothetical protein
VLYGTQTTDFLISVSLAYGNSRTPDISGRGLIPIRTDFVKFWEKAGTEKRVSKKMLTLQKPRSDQKISNLDIIVAKK